MTSHPMILHYITRTSAVPACSALAAWRCAWSCCCLCRPCHPDGPHPPCLGSRWHSRAEWHVCAWPLWAVSQAGPNCPNPADHSHVLGFPMVLGSRVVMLNDMCAFRGCEPCWPQLPKPCVQWSHLRVSVFLLSGLFALSGTCAFGAADPNGLNPANQGHGLGFSSGVWVQG